MCRTTTGDVGKGGRWDVDDDGGPIPAPPTESGHECLWIGIAPPIKSVQDLD